MPDINDLQVRSRKQPAVANPRRWATGALSVAATAIAAHRLRATRHARG